MSRWNIIVGEGEQDPAPIRGISFEGKETVVCGRGSGSDQTNPTREF
jgi:hypothetical protein